MAIVTLTTDFGLEDGNAALLKGVIWRITPSAQVVDLTHLIQPQNIFQASLVLLHVTPHFPEDSIHVVVVDPGVGTARRSIAAKIAGQYFVCPDNGVLSAVLAHAKENNQPVEGVHLTDSRFWLPQVSHVFHGRDIYAPVGAHLAKGEPLQALGDPINDFVSLDLPSAERTEQGWRGQVLYIDHFGNIATNLLQNHCGEAPDVTVKACGATINGMVKTFGERKPGEIVALYGSPGNLIVSKVNGNAAVELGAKIGDTVEVCR